MKRLAKKEIFKNWLRVSISLSIILTMLMTSSPQVSLAWDAGTESRRHIEGTGGENKITIFDTRPYWAKSTAFANSGRVADCPAGYTNTGATCYRAPSTISNPSILGNCPAGYTNAGLSCYRGPDTYSKGCTTVFKKFECREGYTDNGCTCGRGASSLSLDSMVCPSGYTKGTAGRCYKACPSGYTNNGEFCGRGADTLGVSRMTCAANEEKVIVSGTDIPRCYQKPVCPSGFEYWGLLCYIAAPGVKRTAVSTVTMEVKQGGNTHLWIVNRALDLLAQSNDTVVRAFAAKMNESAVRSRWEDGIWEGDSIHVDYPENMGTHFYNPAGKDWNGNVTDITTYNISKGSILPVLLGITGGPAGGTVVSDTVGKLMFKNKKSCANARECATAQIAKVKGGLNATNAYELGLALHYMTDLTQPMHTSSYDGFKIPNNLHPQYEYYAAFVQGNSPIGSMKWDPRWISQSADSILNAAALKSNGFAPRLSKALHMNGDGGIVSIQSFNGIGPYTGYNIYNDSEINKITDEILRDAYQSTANYLYAVSQAVK